MTNKVTDTFSSGSFILARPADVGGDWRSVNGAWGTGDAGISGGSVVFGADGVLFYANDAAIDANQTLSGTFTPTADNWIFALMPRVQAGDSAYLIVVSPGSVSVNIKGAGGGWISSTMDTLSTGAANIAAGDRSAHTVSVDLSGSTFVVVVDGTTLDFGGAVTDGTITAAGEAGFGGRSCTCTVFTADDDSGGGGSFKAAWLPRNQSSIGSR